MKHNGVMMNEDTEMAEMIALTLTKLTQEELWNAAKLKSYFNEVWNEIKAKMDSVPNPVIFGNDRVLFLSWGNTMASKSYINLRITEESVDWNFSSYDLTTAIKEQTIDGTSIDDLIPYLKIVSVEMIMDV